MESMKFTCGGVVSNRIQNIYAYKDPNHNKNNNITKNEQANNNNKVISAGQFLFLFLSLKKSIFFSVHFNCVPNIMRYNKPFA